MAKDDLPLLFSLCKWDKMSGLVSILLSLIYVTPVCQAQRVPVRYQQVLIGKKPPFDKIPANWAFADSIVLHPEKANSVRTVPGERILIGKAGEGIYLPVNTPNFKLYLRYTLSPGASATLSLPGGATILLTERGSSQVSGYTGQMPVQDAGKMAGLIQTLEIDYESNIPRLAGKACFNEVKLNGVVVQQGQYVDLRPAAAPGIRVDKGTVAVSAIGIQALEYRRPVTLSNLSYKIYNDPWDSRKTDLLGESGNSSSLTVEVADGKKTFNLVYEGELAVTEEGDYGFTALYSGAYCQLSLNGNVILDTEQSDSREAHATHVKLDAGTYKLKIWYSKLPWKQAALGLRIGKSDIRDYDLHAPASLPDPPVRPFLTADPGYHKPEMVRSFLQLPGEEHKRTHCLSVGSPAHRHYSVDLNRGALLQVWSGEFANTTEMWYQRGQAQLLNPRGLTEPVSGRSSFVRLSTPEAPWLDSAAISFQGYRIDKDGFPAIRYVLGASVIEDAIRAAPGGISRTVTPERNALPANYVLLAEGARITPIERGLYNVDGRFYVKIAGNQSALLRQVNGKSELLLPLATPVTYAILW